MENFIAKREYYKVKEMSSEQRNLDVTFSFTYSQFENIKVGILPLEMGDRWFVFYEDGYVYFHIWTGECIYQMHLVNSGGKILSDEIIVVNDVKVKPIIDDESEIGELIHLIKYSLLHGENFEIIK